MYKVNHEKLWRLYKLDSLEIILYKILYDIVKNNE